MAHHARRAVQILFASLDPSLPLPRTARQLAHQFVDRRVKIRMRRRGMEISSGQSQPGTCRKQAAPGCAMVAAQHDVCRHGVPGKSRQLRDLFMDAMSQGRSQGHVVRGDVNRKPTVEIWFHGVR